MPRSELVRLFMQQEDAAIAVSVLAELGDIVCVGTDIVILSPQWLSSAVSQLLLPDSNWFNGIRESKEPFVDGTIHNGMTNRRTLLDCLSRAKDSDDAKAGLLVNSQADAESLLDMLVSLDVLFPLDSAAASDQGDSKSRDKDLFLIPARIVRLCWR